MGFDGRRVGFKEECFNLAIAGMVVGGSRVFYVLNLKQSPDDE